MDEFRRRQPCLQGACALCLQRRQVFGKAPVLARRGRPWSGAVRDGVGTCSCSWASEVRNSSLPHSYLTFFSLALPGEGGKLTHGFLFSSCFVYLIYSELRWGLQEGADNAQGCLSDFQLIPLHGLCCHSFPPSLPSFCFQMRESALKF